MPLYGESSDIFVERIRMFQYPTGFCQKFFYRIGESIDTLFIHQMILYESKKKKKKVFNLHSIQY